MPFFQYEWFSFQPSCSSSKNVIKNRRSNSDIDIWQVRNDENGKSFLKLIQRGDGLKRPMQTLCFSLSDCTTIKFAIGNEIEVPSYLDERTIVCYFHDESNFDLFPKAMPLDSEFFNIIKSSGVIRHKTPSYKFEFEVRTNEKKRDVLLSFYDYDEYSDANVLVFNFEYNILDEHFINPDPYRIISEDEDDNKKYLLIFVDFNRKTTLDPPDVDEEEKKQSISLLTLILWPLMLLIRVASSCVSIPFNFASNIVTTLTTFILIMIIKSCQLLKRYFDLAITLTLNLTIISFALSISPFLLFYAFLSKLGKKVISIQKKVLFY